MKNILTLLLLLIQINISFSQDNIDPIIDFSLSYRGLTRDDITIPINFDKEKSPTNDSKLLLPLVHDIMKEPMKSFGFMDRVSNLSEHELDYILLKKIFDYTDLTNEYNNVFILMR